MPRYRVLQPGFYGGVLRTPGGPHDPVVTPMPFPKDQTPSWLELIPEETATRTAPKAAPKPVAGRASGKVIEDLMGEKKEDNDAGLTIL